jgi:ABC-type ATPase with predicted acetyltransferase domain
MARAASRARAENTAAICVAVHNAHVADARDVLHIEDLCPWLARRREPEARMTMAELGATFGHKFPGA